MVVKERDQERERDTHTHTETETQRQRQRLRETEREAEITAGNIGSEWSKNEGEYSEMLPIWALLKVAGTPLVNTHVSVRQAALQKQRNITELVPVCLVYLNTLT